MFLYNKRNDFIPFTKKLFFHFSYPLRIHLKTELMIQVRELPVPELAPTPSRVPYLRQHYADNRILGVATELLLSSRRRKSSQSYSSPPFASWVSWCIEQGVDPISVPIYRRCGKFLGTAPRGRLLILFRCYRSMKASMHVPVDGNSVGQHPLVCRLLKGAFHLRLPLPCYTGTLDVSRVLVYLDSHDLEHTNFTLKLLTLRTVMLLTLTHLSRSVDLAGLSPAGFRMTPEGAVFLPVAQAKQSNPSRVVKELFFPRFAENAKLCPVRSLSLYLERTRQLRGSVDQLFIAIIKLHLPVTSSTIARWLKVIGALRIDTNIIKTHSVRSAATSAAANQGVTTEGILKAADWSTESSFQWFYYKPLHNTEFPITVLSSFTKNTIDMRDWAFWNIIAEWLRSRILVEWYSGLYEEGEVQHINGPTLPHLVGIDMHSSLYLGWSFLGHFQKAEV